MKNNMKMRVITGAALILLLALAIWLGGWVEKVILVAALGVAQYEMMRAVRERGHQNVRWPIWAATVFSIPIFLLWDNQLLLPLVVATALITTAYVLFHGEPHLDDIFVSLMPLFTVALPGMCLLAQTNAPYRWLQVMLVSASFLIPNMGDMFALFVGSRFGKRKLIPAVSPNKTVAGAVGGLLGSEVTALLVWLLVYAFTDAAVHALMPPLWHFALLGIVGGVVGQIGDLFASLVKRHCGIKDYGTIFPGHGGMMDRLDSTLPVAVLLFLYQLLMKW